MAQEVVYADLNIPSGSPGCRAPLSSQPLVSQLVSEKGQTPVVPDCDGAGSRDTGPANCSTCLEHFRSNLTQRLCSPARPGPAGGSGCKLCPTDWRLSGDKCYWWVSSGSKTWNESCSDCAERGSRLLVIRDRAELESLQDLTHGTRQFWVGLSVPSAEKGWTWMDGSQLDRTLILGPGQAEGSSCGVVKGNQIKSESCSSAFQWVCQRDAIPL
uniref:C-type lectin domain-containing protein n=1 Tax=Pelusios castaneus TaxID=367368 RepID=A0A8C8RK59_9SAUR